MRLHLVLALSASAVLGMAVACSSSDDASSTAAADAGAASSSASSGASTSSSGASASSSGASTSSSGSADAGEDANDVDAGPFVLTSLLFADGGAIPAEHTCDGTNPSPPLAWSGAPKNTVSYAIVMRDLTLGGSGNYHWVIYDIGNNTTSLPARVAKTALLLQPPGAKQTYWSFGPSYGYSGPCPPKADGAHTYEFEVLAFSTAPMPITQGETSPAAADAILQANKIASAKLTGTYDR